MFIKASCEKLQYSGRIDNSDPERPIFVFPCSSVTIRFYGSEIQVVLENQRLYWDNYIGVILDGTQTKIQLKDGGQVICLGRDLDDGEHTLMLLKDRTVVMNLLFADLKSQILEGYWNHCQNQLEK